MGAVGIAAELRKHVHLCSPFLANRPHRVRSDAAVADHDQFVFPFLLARHVADEAILLE